MKQLGARLGFGQLGWKRHKRTHSFPDEALLGVADSGVASVDDEGKQPPRGAAAPVSKRRVKKLQRYSSELGLDHGENVLKVSPCFLVSDLLIQGCLIITERHVCFHSGKLGVRKRKKIKFEDIVQISKEKVFGLFPTGLTVRTRADKVTFSSATSRDRLLQLLRQQQQLVAGSPDSQGVRDAAGEAAAEAPASPEASTMMDGWSCGTHSPSNRSSGALVTHPDSPWESILSNQHEDRSDSIASECTITRVTAADRLRPTDRRLHSNKTDSNEDCLHVHHIPKLNKSITEYQERIDQSKKVYSRMADKMLQGLLLVLLLFILGALAISGVLFSHRLGEMERQLRLGAGYVDPWEFHLEQRTSTPVSAAAKQYPSLDSKLLGIVQAVTQLRNKLLLMRPLLQRVISEDKKREPRGTKYFL